MAMSTLADAKRQYRVRDHEQALRTAIRVWKQHLVDSAASTTTSKARRALSETQTEAVELTVVVAALALNRACNSAAMYALYDADVPWSPTCLRSSPRPDRTESALQLLKVAELALADEEVAVLVRKAMHRPLSAVADSNAMDPAVAPYPVAQFAVAWPQVATSSNAAAVYYVSGNVRRAVILSDAAFTMLAATGTTPDELVHCALAATGGALPVAKQLVCAVVSHACILRASSLQSPTTAQARQRLDAAHLTAKLGVSLARTLNDLSLARAAVDAANVPDERDEGIWPGLFSAKVATPLLLSFALYNAGVIAADMGDVENAASLLRAAEGHAVSVLSSEHSFVRLIRGKAEAGCGVEGRKQHLHALANGGHARCATVAAEKVESDTRPLVCDRGLRELRAAHGDIVQRRGAETVTRRPRKPAIATVVPAAHVACSWRDESWLDAWS